LAAAWGAFAAMAASPPAPLATKEGSAAGLPVRAGSSAGAGGETRVAANAGRLVQPGEALQPLLDAAAEGETVRLASGRHAGPIVIRGSIVLVGEPGALIEGNGKGSVVTIEAPGTRIEGLEIRGSGTDVPGMDAAIFLRRSAQRTQ